MKLYIYICTELEQEFRELNPQNVDWTESTKLDSPSHSVFGQNFNYKELCGKK